MSDGNDPSNEGNAIFKRASDGIVLINQDVCIGCKNCIQSCPCGAPRFNSHTEKVEKCTFCDHRLKAGFLPACVTTCVGNALHLLGDFEWLKQEYMDLFAVPTGRYVTPFEDVYLGKTRDGKPVTGPLIGEKAISVRRTYRGAGAVIDHACKELPTHIGVELSFMSFLCEMEAAAIRTEGEDGLQDRVRENTKDSLMLRDLQTRFLQEHISEWFPRLSQSIQVNTKSRFYRGLALLTEAFLAQDTARLLTQSETLCGPEEAR